MPDIQTEVDLLIGDRGRTDPRLFAALSKLNSQLARITLMVEPLVAQSELQDLGEIDIDTDSPIASFLFTGNTLRLLWQAVSGAFYYEIRVGIDWDTASFQARTVNLRVDLEPIAVGSTTYLIKSINGEFEYSQTTTTLVVTVPEIPNISLEGRVIDNTILIRWDPPVSSFTIDYYEIFREDISLGRTRDTFFTRYEAVGGLFTYKIIAVDLYGNRSISSDAALSLDVSAPPDYVLQYSRISDLSGTRVGSGLSGPLPFPSLLFSIIDETWEEHFTNNGWANIQDQLDAGYPLYIQPTGLSGSYTETFDFETLFSTTIITIQWNSIQIGDKSTVTVKIASSSTATGENFLPYTLGSSQLINNIRRLRLRLEVSNPNDDSLLVIYGLGIYASIKREQDGGEINALKTDTNGTPVTFNKIFKDIETVVATVKETEAFIVVVDFLDAPDPTGFEVYVFNRLGVRVTKTVEWSARGVI